MKDNKQNKDGINEYLEDREYMANTYVMRCFGIFMFLYFIVFLLNWFGIFIVDKSLMKVGFVPVLAIYVAVYLITKRMSLSDRKTKYGILFSVILVFTIVGVTVTYHAVFIVILPMLYATLYASKRVIWYVYGLMVLSTIICRILLWIM